MYRSWKSNLSLTLYTHYIFAITFYLHTYCVNLNFKGQSDCLSVSFLLSIKLNQLCIIRFLKSKESRFDFYISRVTGEKKFLSLVLAATFLPYLPNISILKTPDIRRASLTVRIAPTTTSLSRVLVKGALHCQET